MHFSKTFCLGYSFATINSLHLSPFRSCSLSSCHFLHVLLTKSRPAERIISSTLLCRLELLEGALPGSHFKINGPQTTRGPPMGGFYHGSIISSLFIGSGRCILSPQYRCTAWPRSSLKIRQICHTQQKKKKKKKQKPKKIALSRLVWHALLGLNYIAVTPELGGDQSDGAHYYKVTHSSSCDVSTPNLPEYLDSDISLAMPGYSPGVRPISQPLERGTDHR